MFLELNIKIEKSNVLIAGLKKLDRDYPAAINRGLSDIIMGVYGEAFKLLSGPGAKVKTTGTAVNKKIKNRRDTKQDIGAGKYPVPVRTANLKDLLNFVLPGRTKSTGGLSFGAGKNAGIVYNASEYARIIHEGLGTSRKHGPRRYITDGVTKYDRGGKMARDLETQIDKELKKL